MKRLLKWADLLLILIVVSAVLIWVQMPFGCVLCDCPPRSALRLVDLQTGEVLDLELPSASETFSLLRCGNATGYRQGNQCEIRLEASKSSGKARQNLCRGCQKRIPENFAGGYVLLLMDGNAVKETLCLNENREYSYLNYRISVQSTESELFLLVVTQ